VTNKIKQLIRLLSRITFLWLGFACIVQPLSANADDLADDKRAADSVYYTALPQSVRKVGQAEQFLFTVNDPSSVDSPVFPGCRLVLAQHDKEGTSIVWQYRLSESETAGIPIWFGDKSEKDKSHIFVMLNNNTCLTFSANGITPPQPEKHFSIHSANGVMDLNLHQAFFAYSFLNNDPVIFFSRYALLELDLVMGKTQAVFQLPVLSDNFTHYLAVEDLDGDGTTDIVGDTSLAQIVKGEVVHSPGTIRVWHSTPQGYQQIYASTPRHHWTVESDAAPMGADKKPVIVANELSEAVGGVDLYLHLYHWDGHTIQEITSSQGVVPPLGHDGFTLAALDGQGRNSILAMVSSYDGTTHLSVLNLVQNRLIKSWMSPPMYERTRFGRVSDYEHLGKQEVPLVNPDTGKISLFKQVDNKYLGWEAMRLPPPPPPPPSPADNTRFFLEERDGTKSTDPPRNLLMLDGNVLTQVFPNTREINAEYRAQQIQKRVLNLAKQKFPPAQVVARKVGDEDEEPKMEVAAGKTIVITLTEGEAKTAGKPLPVLTQEWVSAVRQVLTTLAKPPK